MDKKSSSTTERFTVTDADNDLGEMSQPSTQLLAELIDYLRARGDEQDAGLALALESQGWGVLTAAQIQMLLLQFKALAQADAQQLAQADANATQDNVTTTDGATGSAALSALKPIAAETKDAAPAPASSSAPAPSFAGQILELLSRSDLVAPSNSVQISAVDLPLNVNAPTLGSAIVNSLAAGQFPGVSAATAVQSNAAAPLAVPGIQTPPVVAPTTAPNASAAAPLLASTAGVSSGASSSTSSNVAVSRMPASDSLGGSAELSNAASITPYVEQKVSTTGSLVSAPVVQGSTESANTKVTTSYVQPSSADVLGSAVPIARVIEKPAPQPAEAPRPPDPFGNVTLGFHKSMLLSSEVLDGVDTNLDLPRKIQEGTSPEGATPVHLLVSRINPLMPDDIPFVITGLNGHKDVINVMFGDTEINQTQIILTVDPDGTLRGLVHFEGGQTDKVLTINIRQDATVETLETMSVNLQPGVFGLLLTGNHAVDMNVVNDDFAVVSITANAPTYDGPGASDTLPQVVENTDSNTAYTEVSFTVTRTVPARHGEETSGGVPLLADRMDWSVLTTGAGNISAADIHPGDLSGQIDFAEGEMSRVVTVRVLKDALREDSAENLTLQLSAAASTYSVLGTSNATTRIADDDGLVSIARATNQAAAEDEGSDNINDAHTLTFTVTRTNSLMADTFAYSIDGIDEEDLLEGTLTDNTVSFAAGETSKNITVVLRKDFNVEADETVTVTLADGTYAQVESNHGSADVLVSNDDKVRVSITADAAQLVEGTEEDGFTEMTFTVSRLRPDFHDPLIPLPADEFDWSVDFSARLSEDDVHSDDFGGIVSFAEGENTAQITVRVRKDVVREDFNEQLTVSLDLSRSSIAVPGDATEATALVVDDDGLWRVDLAPLQAAQVDEGTGVDQSIESLAVTGSSQSVINYLPSSGAGGTVLQTSHTLSDFDPYQSSFVFGGAWITDDAAPAQVREVVHVSASRMTFWALFREGSVKAVKVQVDQVDGGLQFSAIAQKYFPNISDPAAIANLDVGGTATSLATSLDTGGYGLHDIEAVFRTDAPASTSVVVADAAHYLPTGNGKFVAGYTLAQFQPYASSFNLGGAYIGFNSLEKTVREVDWISPTSMNFWVSMSDPQYTKAVKVHAEDVVVDGVTTGVRFNVVSAQYVGNNGQTYQVLGDFGYGFSNQGVALAAGQPGYGLSGFTAVFANDADAIPTESFWLSGDTNYLQSAGVVVNTDFTLDQFDAANTVLQIGGGDVLDDAVNAPVYQVSPIVDGALTFWAAAIDEDGTVMAVKIRAEQTVNGIRFTPLEAKIFDEVAHPDEIVDFDTEGALVDDIAVRDDALGIGVHHFEAAFAAGEATYTTKTLSFEVTRTNGSQGDTVAYHIEGVQASDLANPNSGELAGVLQFAPGEVSQIVTITIRQDSTVERDEAATIVLDDTDSLYAHTDPAHASATVAIANDDFLSVRIAAEMAATFEGNVDGGVTTTELNFTVTRTKPAGVDDSEGWPADDISWSVYDPTGQIVLGEGMTRNAETGMVSGVLHFDAAPAGTASQSLPLVLSTDRNSQQESDWRAQVVLDDGEFTQASDAAGSAATWVLDDDPSITLDPNPPAVLEGGVLRFTIHRSTALDTAFDVHFQLLPTSGGANYISSADSGIVHFAIGQEYAYVDVQTVNDAVVNDPRQVVLNLTGADNLEDINGEVDGRVFIQAGSAVGRITSDDATLSIQSIVASEPDANDMVTFTVTVERAGALGFEHGVTWNVFGAGENPLPVGDLQLPTTRVVTFEPNAADVDSDTRTFTFVAPAGMIVDGIRTFEVRIADLPDSEDADVAARTNLGVDAARGELTPNGVSASIVPMLTNLAEGSVTPAEHRFQVQLSQVSDRDIVVAWHVQDYASGSALDATADDFVGGQWPSGQVTIAAGSTWADIAFSPSADSTLELSEKFKVAIEIVSGPAGVVGPVALGGIVNDDARIGFAEPDATFSVFEGPEGQGAELVAYVNREGFNRTNVSVGWHVELVDASDAAAWDDLFNGEHPSGRLEILAGQAVGAISIALAGDNVLEASERFKIVLEDNVQGGAELSANREAIGVIANDDAVISMGAVTVSDTEGHGGTKTITVTVLRDTQGERLPAADVSWVALPTGAGADYASAADFAAGKFPSGTVRFAPGANEATISIVVKADAMLESNESFVVTLTGTPTLQHRLADDANALSTTVTLRNDDDEISFVSGGNLNQSVLEDGAEHIGQTLTYTLTRQGDTTKETTVQWHLDFAGRTASASDFLDASGLRYADGDSIVGTAVFAPNSSTATLTLRVNDDFKVEGDQTFAVVLDSTGLAANGSALALDNTTATGTLLNDDVGIVATLVGSAMEGDGDNITFTYSISRVGDLTQASSIAWNVTGARLALTEGNVTMASPLTDDEITSAQTGTLQWASGESDVKTVTVTVAGDLVAEGDEAFQLLLSNATGAGLHPSELTANGLTGAVHDNDAKIGIQALSTTTVEGAEGTSQTITYEITRTGDLSQTLTVQLNHSGATGVSGPSAITLNPADQQTVTLTYDDGRPDQTFTLRGDTQRVQVEFTLLGDDILELNEALTVSLGAITGQTGGHNASVDSLHASASTAITNDDARVFTSTSAPYDSDYNAKIQVEGATNGSPTDPVHTVTYTLTRDPAGSLAADTVSWRIVGHGDSVVNANDFAPGQQAVNVPNNGMPSGTVTFAAGATTASTTIVVRLSGDLDIEPSEGLALQLSSQSGNVEFDPLAEDAVLVVADDAGYSITAREAQVIEGNESSATLALTFDIASVGAPGTIYWKANGITAADVVDGQALSGSFVFNPSVESSVLRLQVRQDSIVNDEKTASITLYSDAAMTIPLLQQGASLVASTTLKDDDAEVSVTAGVTSVTEGSDPARGVTDPVDVDGLSDDFKALTFTIDRSGNLNQTSTVPWSVSLTGGLTVSDFYGNFPTTATATGWYDEANAAIKGWITFDAAATAGYAVDHRDTMTQTVTLRVKTDWLEEANETVTVQLGQPSFGTSLKDTRTSDGSDAASTVVNNDDATVQFATGSLVVSHVEGNDFVGDSTFDGDYVEYQFTVERTGNTNIESTVTWTLSGAGITTDDFQGYSAPELNGLNAGALPYGTVQFGTGETTKTVTVRVKSDDFEPLNYGIASKGQSLEADETFTVTLSNGRHVNPSNQGDLTESVGTTVEGRTSAQGVIVNDDVQIQITQIRTSLPEGVAPVDGDVNLSLDGVQRYIEQAITFVRQGDPSQAVSFNWSINAGEALFYHDGATFAGVLVVNGDPAIVGGEFDLAGLTSTLATAGANTITGTVSWAAGDSTAKTIIFRPAGNNDIGGFDYTLSTTSNSVLIDEFTSGTSDSTVLNRGIADTKTLARFSVERDEAGVWLSNQVIEQYDPWTSQLVRIPQQYTGYDYYSSPNGIDYSPTRGNGTVEGSLGTAEAGLDYSSTSGTLTFTAAQRVQTLTLNVLEDGTYETTEGLSVYLGQTSGAVVSVADNQGTVAVLDNDGTPVQALRVLGQTAIEGVDTAAEFVIDLGKAVSGTTTLNVNVTQDEGTARVSTTAGEAADHTRYFEYSTDGGQTWQTNAPVFDFTYTAGRSQAVDDQLTVAYDFNNSDGNSWDSWLEFSDLKTEVDGQRVGNTLTGKSHGIPEASRIDVVVDSLGGWVDTDGDRYRDGDERQAFDYWGNDQIDLQKNSVSITFIEAPDNSLSLWGFDENDRINIDYGRLHNTYSSGEGGSYANYDGIHYVQANRHTEDMPYGVDWHKGYTKSGSGGLRDDQGFAVAGQSGNYRLKLYGFSAEGSMQDTLAYGLYSNLDQTQIFDRVSFVNVGEGEQPPSLDGPQQLNVWIAVRADAAVAAADLGVKISGSGGEMQGRIGGVLDLSHAISDDAVALRQEFLAWWNAEFPNNTYAPQTDAEWMAFGDGVQAYFDDFAARLSDAPQVQFVQVQVDWDGYGQMSWSVEGLDPTVVLAPQNDSPFGGLQLLQDITVDAGTTSASADVALGAQAIFDTDNGMSAVAALERDGLQPSFEVSSDETDANGVRTVTIRVSRPADLGDDVLRYQTNFPSELTSARLLSGSAALSGQVAFADGETEKDLVFIFNAALDGNAPIRDLPLKLHVIVDHNPNDATGAVGAYIDTDRDGVLDAAEAVASNLAFSATGEDLVGVNARSVTVRFNDFTATPLNLSGFGGDDRIEINLDEMSRHGWKVGAVTEFSFTSDRNYTIRDGNASTSMELTGRTAMGRYFGFDFSARRESLSSNYTACLSASGYRWTENGDEYTNYVFATFGAGENQNPIIDGAMTLAGQISFVNNPTVHVVVQAEGAYIDLDQDGVLDANEATDANRAFDAQGQEVNAVLRHAPVVLHFNDAPTTVLDLRNFGRDDRIELDVAEFRANGWDIPAADAEFAKRLLTSDQINEGDAAVALVYASGAEGDADDFFGVVGNFTTRACSNELFSNSAAIKWVSEGGDVQTAVFGSFGLNGDGNLRNPMLEDDHLYRRVSFVNIDGPAQPAEDIHVIVDRYEISGQQAVGAFIDLDKDGVLDANEATQDNLAFNADGSANIDLARDSVTVQFNDAHGKTMVQGMIASTVPLDFSGFGVDDRIEINLNGLSANGWRLPDDRLTSYDMDAVRYTNSNYWDSINQQTVWERQYITRSYLELSGCTALSHELDLEVLATNSGRHATANYVFKIRAEHARNSGESYTYENIRLAEFSDAYFGIGSGEFIKQVSFVRDPVVHVVVEKDGAFFDLDADGRLDDNEMGSENRANEENGLDLAHQSVVVRFNEIPEYAVDLSGFGRDDRIEIDVARMGLVGAFDINRDFSINENYWSCNSGRYASSTTNTDWSSRMVANRPSDELSVQFVRTHSHGETRRTWADTTTRFEAWYSYSNRMSISGQRVANFGNDEGSISGLAEEGNLATATQWNNQVEGPSRLIDANGGMLNRVSFVSSTQRVLVTEDGGWIDRDADGVLDTVEKTEANRAFAADGSALINLQDNSYVLRFLDAPDNTLDLSGFNRDDRIEIDQNQLAARGWTGADNSAQNFDTTRGSYATKMEVNGISGQLAVMAGDVFGSDGLFLFGSDWGRGTKAMLGDFGPDNGTGGEGDLTGRLSFVQSTLHVVVESHGAYLDENANGKLDDNESVNVFDPFTGEALINLRNHKVVIEFNDVPDVALDLSGFNSDDRVEIDRQAFHAAGWGGQDAVSAVENWSSYSTSGARGFIANGGQSRLIVALDNSDLSLSAATKGDTSRSGQLAYGMGEGDAPQTVFNNVSFVQDNFIQGFGADHAISLTQGGSLSGTGMQYGDGDITVDAGTSEVLVRLPVVDDNIDERVETITVSVTTDDPDFMVNSGSTTVALVDNDSPQITTEATSLYDAQLGQGFVVQVVDINNRDGDSPDIWYEGDPGEYRSNSLQSNEAAAQDFTLTLRVQGNWQVALVADDYNNGYNASTGASASLNLHQSPPAFRPVAGAVDERDADGQLTGYQLVDVLVPAGTQQVLLRLPVDDLNNEFIVEDSVSGMRIDVTHVAPVLVVRDTVARESDDQVEVEVIAVGGDLGDDDTLTVDYSTQEGQWEERLFLVSRELATAGRLTVSWSVEALGGEGQAGLEDGNGGDYIRGYAGQQSIQTVDSNDFVILQDQSAGVGGLPAGTVTFEDGEKEVYIRVAVRTDNVGEEREDFRVVLSNVPAGVSLDPNPIAPATFADREHAGYATIANDDQLFVVTGLVFKESFSSKVVIDEDGDAVGSYSHGLAIAGTPSGMTAPEGYTLHQFIVRREGDARAPASVDWTLTVSGSDVAGFVESAEAAQAAGAHAMETADFLTYTSGDYDSALGLSWTGSTTDAKTVVFAAGESYKVITLAIKDDALAEDAETFTVALSNPQALPGNDGNPGVSPLRGEATFVVGDNDGTKVSVALDWLSAAASASGTAQALQNDLGREAVIDNAVYEGTGSDWLAAGNNNYSNSDTSNDRRLQITFTRSAADATASQAFFEIALDQQNSSMNTWVLESSEGTGSVTDASWWGDVSQHFWRGTVDFAAGATTANVIFRIPDDNLVEGNQNITVTLYDAEHLPESAWDTRHSFNAGATLNDAEGIGHAANLPDWNTTIRDPDAYTATATVVDNDVRLWLGGWQAANGSYDSNVGNDGVGDATGYDRTPNLVEFDGELPFTNDVNDPAYGAAANQVHVAHGSAQTGDVELTFVRAGVQAGDIVLNWEVVLDGTATADDFTRLTGTLTLAGGQGTTESTSFNTVIENLLVADRVVENNETFHLQFTVASIDNADVGGAANVLFTPNYDKERQGVQYHDSSLNGQASMVVDAVIRNDDLSYGIAWAANTDNADVTIAGVDAKVVEGDDGDTYIDFVVNRALGADNSQGYKEGSTVAWRVVPVEGSLATVSASDFVDGVMGGVASFTGWSNTNGVYTRFNPVADEDGVLRYDDVAQLVRLRINPDSKVEYGEHFTIELYNPSMGFVDPAASRLTATLVNDDTGLIINDFKVMEGDSTDGDTSVQVTVLRVGDLSGASDLNWNQYNIDTQTNDVAGATSGALSQITSSSGAIESAVDDGFGVQSQVITLTGAAALAVVGDNTVEEDELFRVKLSKVSGIEELLVGDSADQADGNATNDTVAALANQTFVLTTTGATPAQVAGQAYVTVQNDDTVFSVAADQHTVVENSGGTFSFTITRSVATPQAQTVTWEVLAQGGRNLVNASDFTGGALPTGTVTFAAGELSKTISVPFAPAADSTAEADEVFTVQITGYGNGAENDTFVVTGVGAKGTIVNDDAAVFISDGRPVVQAEGSSGTRTYLFDVVRSGSASGDSTVDWELVLNGTAVSSDFVGATSGTLTFSDNGTQTVSIGINPDMDRENAETFSIRLKNATGGVGIVDAVEAVGPNMAATLGDDDFDLTVAPTGSAVELDGRNTLAFVVTRDGNNALPANVSWSLAFGVGATQASASDFRDINDSNASDGLISGTFVLPSGVDSYTFYVPVQGESQWEENESFTLNMVYDRNNGSAPGSTSTEASIVNDDEGFWIEFLDATVDENGGPVSFRVVREGNLTGSSDVAWTLNAGTATLQTTSGNPTDFGDGNSYSGTVTFTGSESSATGANGQQYAVSDWITVNLAGDSRFESDETFTVTLSNPGEGSSIKTAQATATIVNDDMGYSVAVDQASVVEGDDPYNAGLYTELVYTITRSSNEAAIGQASTVDWILSKTSGSATALEAADVLGGALSGRAQFAAGQTSVQVTVKVIRDGLDEGDSIWRMALNTVNGGGEAVQATAQTTVIDDDSTVSVSALQGLTVATEAPAEGNLAPSVQSYYYNLTRTGSNLGVATVNWQVGEAGAHSVDEADIDSIWLWTNGVAEQIALADRPSPGMPFVSGSVTFADGDTAARQLEVRLKHDRTGEYDEQFSVSLSSGAFGTNLGTANVEQTVVNDDPVLMLSMANTRIAEGNPEADTAFTFLVTRSGDTTGVSSFQWRIESTDSSLTEEDFGGLFPSGSVTFSAGQSQKYVTVLTGGDALVESNENFRVVIHNAVGADILGDSFVDASIVDDDVAVSVEAVSQPLVESATGAENAFRFAFNAEGPANATLVRVFWHVEGSSLHPTIGDDFVGDGLPSGSTEFTLRNGTGYGFADILVAGDNVYGPDERFKIVIDDVQAFAGNTPLGAAAVVSSAEALILDDDIQIGLDQDQRFRVVEGTDGVDTELRFYVDVLGSSGSSPSMADVRVNYSLTGDVDADDFTTPLSQTDVALAYDSDEGRYYVGMTVKGDVALEDHERFSLRLSSSQDNVDVAAEAATVSGEIRGDDFGIQLATVSTNQWEDSARFTIEVLRMGPTDLSMDVQVQVGAPLSGSGDVASADDFIDLDSLGLTLVDGVLTGDLHFNAGQGTARFTLEAAHDFHAENDERFTVLVEVTDVDGASVMPTLNEVDTLDLLLYNESSDALLATSEPEFDSVIMPVV